MSDASKAAPTGFPPLPPRHRVSERQAVLLALVVLALLAVLLLVPGVFTIDESNYLAWVVSLRALELHPPGTDGLTFSRELVFFDPLLASRAPGPIVSTMPPLYALFALPFSLFGWTGLFLLNTSAWLATTALLYASARQTGASPPAAAIGALAFALAGFSLEYAVGVWPHALAACLTLSAFLATLRTAERGRGRTALLAGLLIGLAAGLRYQHAITAAMLGFVLLAATWRRPRLAAMYGLGVALPLALSTVCNGLRAGLWNPISKGVGYISTAGDFSAAGVAAVAPRWIVVRTFLARVLDFSLQPHDPFWTSMGGRWTPAGALLLLSAVKKALLQSAPWILVVLVALLAAWSPRTQAGAHRRALRTVALLCAATFGVFAIATRRFEGWSHNPRYLFDLVPLFAFALALVVERAGLTWRPLAVGTGAGALLALGPLLRHPTSSFRQLSLLYASLALAFVATVLFVACRWLPRLRRAVAVGLGVLLGWASAVHLGDDVRAARALRGANLDRLITVAALLPDVPAALLAHQPAALAPLLLERDLVIADTNADQGQDAGRLAAELLARGRRVFVLAPGMSKRELRAVVSGHQVRPVADAGALFFELEPRSPLL